MAYIALQIIRFPFHMPVVYRPYPLCWHVVMRLRMLEARVHVGKGHQVTTTTLSAANPAILRYTGCRASGVCALIHEESTIIMYSHNTCILCSVIPRQHHTTMVAIALTVVNPSTPKTIPMMSPEVKHTCTVLKGMHICMKYRTKGLSLSINLHEHSILTTL